MSNEENIKEIKNSQLCSDRKVIMIITLSILNYFEWELELKRQPFPKVESDEMKIIYYNESVSVIVYDNFKNIVAYKRLTFNSFISFLNKTTMSTFLIDIKNCKDDT